jgi:hypothetical protein
MMPGSAQTEATVTCEGFAPTPVVERTCSRDMFDEE